jgi:hypothetical protein
VGEFNLIDHPEFFEKNYTYQAVKVVAGEQIIFFWLVI